MKKKILKSVVLVVFIAIIILAIFNVYHWIVCGKQDIIISTTNKVYNDSDLFVSVIAQKNGVDVDSKIKVKLLNSKGKKVKHTKVSYNGNIATINIPKIEPGNYFIEAKVSSKAGKDTVQKGIYIADGNQENTIITLDKGIYKPGDTVNFRALLTNKENDKPIEKDVNICIYDGNDNKVYNENVKTSGYGIVSGAFKLANELNSGIYKLVIKTKTNETTKTFKVNPYIMPKYEVKVNFDKETYLVGDTAVINLNAKYFFGEPVARAKYDVYIDGKKNQTLVADDKGNASINYKIDNAKTYQVKVEAVDDSNYYVEVTDRFTAGTDIFEVELFPEYGELIKGERNDIYVFTKNIDGSPIKTYVTVSSDNFTKQIATDENGIGRFSIDINANPMDNHGKENYRNKKMFKLVAVNMNGEKIEKEVSLLISEKSLLLSTNKVKYNQGEDIEIKISSLVERTKNIYLFKNDKLIKMLTTDSSDTKINLGDTYGIIDVYITEPKNKLPVKPMPIEEIPLPMNPINVSTGSASQPTQVNPYYKANIYRRTIFIKPTKALNIDIKVDKDEYKPGDNITLSFDTTDKENNKIDSALLVSMLDNSILNLADNDLSIDNIKMALSNLKFSDELDATTLYSSIVSDASEQTIMALLLKQGDHNMNISETSIHDEYRSQKAMISSIILIVIVVVSVLVYFSIKFPKFRNVIKHLLNVIIYTVIVFGIIAGIFTEIDLDLEDYFWWALVSTMCVSLITYVLWLSKFIKYISRTSISIIICGTIVYVLTSICQMLCVVDMGSILVYCLTIFVVFVLVWVFISKINERKKFKYDKYIRQVSKEIIYILKFIGALAVSYLLSTVYIWVIENYIDILYDFLYSMFLSVSVVGLYFFNGLFNRIGKDKNLKKKINKKKVWNEILGILAVIGGLSILLVICNANQFPLSSPWSERNIGSVGSAGIKSVDHNEIFFNTDTITNAELSPGFFPANSLEGNGFLPR